MHQFSTVRCGLCGAVNPLWHRPLLKTIRTYWIDATASYANNAMTHYWRFWATFCTTVCPMLSNRRPVCPILSYLSVCNVGVLGQTVGRIKMKLGMQVGLGPGHVVLDADPVPQRDTAPSQFSAHICCGQMARWIKMPLGTEVGLGPGHMC